MAPPQSHVSGSLPEKQTWKIVAAYITLALLSPYAPVTYGETLNTKNAEMCSATDVDSLQIDDFEDGSTVCPTCRRNACECSDAVGCCDAATCSGPQWYASADALFLRRDNSSIDQAIVINGATSETLITTGNLNFDTEAGARLMLGRRLDNDLAIEGGYFGFQEWNDSIRATGNNNLRLPGDLALATFDFLDADIMQVDAESQLHNAELNLAKQLGWIEVLAGFRYFQLDDYLNINAEDFQNGTSDYFIASRNHLYGGQIGTRITQELERFELRCTTKAGLFGNDSSQHSYVADFDNTFVLRNTDPSQGQTAFIGEVNVEGILPITKSLRLRGGYNLLWVEGVGLAADQLDFSDTPTSGETLNSRGGVFFYGANAGLEAIW